MITVKQAAERLGVNVARVRALALAGRIPGAKKLGRDWFLPDPFVVLAVRRSHHGKIKMQ